HHPRPARGDLGCLWPVLAQPAEHDPAAALILERLRRVEGAALVELAAELVGEALVFPPAHEVDRAAQWDGGDEQHPAVAKGEEVGALPHAAGAAVADGG